MLVVLTYILYVLSLLHLFLFLFNRYLLCITDGPWKTPIHLLAFLLLVPLPAAFGILFWYSPQVQGVLRWEPRGAGYFVFLILLALVALLVARSLIWLQDRAFGERPHALISEEVEQPPMPNVPTALPRPFRRFDTTGDLVLSRREIAVSGLSSTFDGLTIAQVADVHFGQRLEMENYLEAVHELVMSLNADLIAFTGDFADKKKDIAQAIAYHARFRGRLGTLCVLGNHDYWTRPDRIREELSKTHIRWLGGGERRTLKREGRRLVFVGVDAPWDGQRPDFERVIRRETGDAVILLSHTPDNAPKAARAGASLILSGHNHGGQMCLPGIGPVIVPSRYGLRYAEGVHRVGADSVLNVSRGVGVSGGGLRLFCKPEVCLLTLRVPIVEVMVGRVIPARSVFSPVGEGGKIATSSWDRENTGA